VPRPVRLARGGALVACLPRPLPAIQRAAAGRVDIGGERRLIERPVWG